MSPIYSVYPECYRCYTRSTLIIGSSSVRGVVAMSHSAPSGNPTPLTGREREQTIVCDVLADTLAGHGRLVLIGGEAGIGKTTLAEAVCAQATEQGARVLVGRSYDLTETPPWGPWLELFGQYQQVDALPAVPAAFAQRGIVGEIRNPAMLFQQVLDFFAALAARRPIVLLFDDLHWADPASLDLLRVVARQLARWPMLMLVT